MNHFSFEYGNMGQEMCQEIKNQLNTLDIQYNQFRKIEFTNKDDLKTTNRNFLVVMILFVIISFISSMLMYFLVKEFFEVSFRLWVLIAFIAFLFLTICILYSKKDEARKTINKIELEDDLLKLFFIDGKVKEYHLNTIHIETKKKIEKDSTLPSKIFLLQIKENKKNKKVFYVDTLGVLNEYLAFYNYLLYIKNGRKYEELDDYKIKEMMDETTYGKKEVRQLANYRVLLILGIVFIFLTGCCFYSIGRNLVEIFSLDKVEATITDIHQRTYYNSDMQRVKEYQTQISYEYMGNTYDNTIYENVGKLRNLKKKITIYVSSDHPEYFQYLRVGIDEIIVTLSFGCLSFGCLSIYKKKVKGLKKPSLH